MKKLILPLVSSIIALSNSAGHAGGGFSRLAAFEGAYPIIRNRISVKPNWQMTELSKKYGTLKSTVGSKPTKPMPEKPSYEEMPKKVRFLDDQPLLSGQKSNRYNWLSLS